MKILMKDDPVADAVQPTTSPNLTEKSNTLPGGKSATTAKAQIILRKYALLGKKRT